jgi:hypothetical protein
MPTQIDWCKRCAAAVYDTDGCAGSCNCAEGQLKQLLANKQGPKTTVDYRSSRPAAPPPSRTPVLAHLKADRVVNPFAVQAAPRAQAPRPPVRLPNVRTASQTELQRAQSLSSVFMREEEEGAPTAPTMADGALEALWSTESSEADMDILGSTRTAAAAPAADANLEALWMGRVARETGMDPTDAPSLDALWMNEIQNNRTASGGNDISFDSDMDSEIASYPQGGGSARPFSVMAPPPRAPISGPRVQIGQAGRFAVMAESETVMTRTAARTTAEAQGRASMGAPLPIVVPYMQRGGSVQNFRDARAAAQASAPPVRRESAIDRAAAYTSRMTSYQHLMSDD